MGLVDRPRKLPKPRDEDENYYGRTVRETCLLTKEQREKHCHPEECDSWRHCPVRIKR